MAFWPVVHRVVYESDVVLLILDARMPDLSRNRELESLVSRSGKEIVYVFNKIDLVSNRNLQLLKNKYPGAFFVAGVKNIGIRELKIQLLIQGKKLKKFPLKVGIVGYPNVGKSAIINALAKRARTAVSAFAGTTKGSQFVRVSQLKIIDTPGVIPFEDKDIRLGLLGAKNPEKIKDNRKLALAIIKKFLNEGRKGLEDFYKIKISSDEPQDILTQIGERRGFLLKGGIVDERRAVLTIITDWQRGKLKL